MRSERWSKRSWLVAAALVLPALGSTAAPTLGQDAAAEGCLVRSIEIEERGASAFLRVGIDGSPGSLGTSTEPGARIVLAFSGCLPDPELSDLSSPAGLVAAVRLTGRTEGGGPVTALAIEIRRPFEYSVRSGPGNVLVELRPTGGAGEGSAGAPPTAPAAAEPPRRELVRVLEPLPGEPPPAPDPSPAEPDASVLGELVERWARAWSEQRVEDYLAFYAAEFRPPGGLDRAAWEAERRRRLTAPRSIEVAFDELRIAFPAPGRAAVSFWQSYRSDRFSDRVYKTLTWIDEGGGWRIVEEAVAARPR